MVLYPGSLNLRLAQAWPLPANTLQISADLVGRHIHLVPCTVLGRRGFVFRTDNAERAGSTEQRTLEILAEVNLRDEHDLNDGDQIDVRIDDNWA